MTCRLEYGLNSFSYQVANPGTLPNQFFAILKKYFPQTDNIFKAFLTGLSPIFSQFLSPDRKGKRETVYLGMFKAKILVLGPCEVTYVV